MKVILEIDISNELIKDLQNSGLDRGQRQQILDDIGELYKQVAIKEIQLRYGMRSTRLERNKNKVSNIKQ